MKFSAKNRRDGGVVFSTGRKNVRKPATPREETVQDGAGGQRRDALEAQLRLQLLQGRVQPTSQRSFATGWIGCAHDRTWASLFKVVLRVLLVTSLGVLSAGYFIVHLRRAYRYVSATRIKVCGKWRI
ncbi:hypothetical protein M8818_000430 [Zalaria obscura]|uniref:Uncharacterized protein n=1 Tax=Zalaria obscura TaxID=2024903 RepID=A0ACC3SMV8_9PEZI